MYAHEHATGAHTECKKKIRSWKIYILPSHHSRHDYVEYVPMSDGMQTLTTEQHSPLGKTTMCWRNATMSQLTKWKCKEQLSYSHKYKNIHTRDLHSCRSTAGPTWACVCVGRGRIKLFAGLPQNRNDLNIKCIKYVNCYLSVAQKQKEQLILTLKRLTWQARQSFYFFYFQSFYFLECLKGSAM